MPKVLPIVMRDRQNTRHAVIKPLAKCLQRAVITVMWNVVVDLSRSSCERTFGNCKRARAYRHQHIHSGHLGNLENTLQSMHKVSSLIFGADLWTFYRRFGGNLLQILFIFIDITVSMLTRTVFQWFWSPVSMIF